MGATTGPATTTSPVQRIKKEKGYVACSTLSTPGWRGLARRVHDARLTRDNQIAAANGWQVQRVSATGTYSYRDPRFDLLTVGYTDDGEAVAVDMRTGKVVAARSAASEGREVGVMPAKSNHRNHRNNPYIFDDFAVKFHRTVAGVLWRWRTELAGPVASLLGFRLLTDHLAVWLAAALMAGSVVLLAGLPWTRRCLTSRFWCLVSRHRLQRLCLRGAAAHPVRPVAADLVDTADTGRGTRLAVVPRGHLRRGLRSPPRRDPRRLLRPRRPIDRNRRWSQTGHHRDHPA